jgi:hypothetical protein
MKNPALLRVFTTSLLSLVAPSILISISTISANAEGTAGAKGPDAEVGLVTSAEGDAEIFVPKTPPAGANVADWKRVRYQDSTFYAKNAQAGDHVPTGTVLQTKSNGKIRFVYNDGDQLNVGPATSLVVENRSFEAKRKKTLLNVIYGRTRAVVKKQENAASENSFMIRTRTAVVGVRGTDFTVDYSPTAERAEVSVLRGAVELSLDGTNTKAEVKSGYSASVHVPPAAPAHATSAAAAEPPPSASPAPAAPSIEMKKTTKEDLATILVFSHVETKENPAKPLPSKVAEEIKKAELTATAAVLEDIKAVDPNLHAKLTTQNATGFSNASELNSAVVGEQIQKAPGEAPKQKKLQKEFKDFDEKIYKKYFDVE